MPQRIGQFKNPFKEAGLWIRGEMLDIQGMLNALKSREHVIAAQRQCEQRRREEITEMEKLSLGQTTLKSFFKSKESKQQTIVELEKSIKQKERTIEDFKKLSDFITVYWG